MEEDQSSPGEGGLGGPRLGRLSTLGGHPLPPRMCFSGAAEGNNNPLGWHWLRTGRCGRRRQCDPRLPGFPQVPVHPAISERCFKSKDAYRQGNWVLGPGSRGSTWSRSPRSPWHPPHDTGCSSLLPVFDMYQMLHRRDDSTPDPRHQQYLQLAETPYRGKDKKCIYAFIYINK